MSSISINLGSLSHLSTALKHPWANHSHAHHAGCRLQVYTPDGELAATYSAYQDALGIKDVSWNASGDLLSVGSYDEVSAAVGMQT